MPEVLRFSDAASLAFHAMAHLARNGGEQLTVSHIAGFLHCSEAHLSKVMQRLQRAGLVRATRGPKGGYRLGLPPESVTLLNVYEAVDGPITKTECLLERPVCGTGACLFGDLLARVGRQVTDYLAKTTLADLSAVDKTDDACGKCRNR